MTESECIGILKYYDKQPWFLSGDQPAAVAFKMAIDALEEIQEFRRIGLGNPAEVEQDLLLYKADRVLVNEYSAIGTAEEFKAIKQWKADITEFFSKYNVNSVLQMTKRFSELTEKEELCDRNIKMFNDIACDIAKKVRAKAIDEFAEAIMVKATEESEKVVFDGRLVGDALSLDCVSDMVLEIALDMKGEKE